MAAYEPGSAEGGFAITSPVVLALLFVCARRCFAEKSRRERMLASFSAQCCLFHKMSAFLIP
jgi:hypothetical protein